MDRLIDVALVQRQSQRFAYQWCQRQRGGGLDRLQIGISAVIRKQLGGCRVSATGGRNGSAGEAFALIAKAAQ